MRIQSVRDGEATTSSELSDEVLMERYGSGDDREAFEALFKRHGGRLFAHFVRAIGAPEIARDLVQQTFLHLHRARADYRSGASFKPWLFTIAMNIRREHFRKLARRPEVALEDRVADSLAQSPNVSSVKDRLVRRALSQLSEQSAQVLLLHWYEDFSYQDIAGMLGISEGAVKVRAHRAYKQMREILGEEV